MGILSINAFLREKCPTAFVTYPVSAFRGRKFSVDACNVVYTYAGACGKSLIMGMYDPLEPLDRATLMINVKSAVINFINTMRQRGIELVWCWDGKRIPEKDEVAGLKRKKDKDIIRERVKTMREHLLSKNPLTRTPQELDEFRKILCQLVVVQGDEMKSVREMVEDLGFASVVAEYEGEKIASNLAQDSLVTAVWSTDTDNYPLGTQLLVTGFGANVGGQEMFDCVYLPTILAMFRTEFEWSNMTFEQSHLLDFCILIGTDFNLNMPRVAAKTAFKLLKQYATIENIAIYGQKDISMLNHVRVREIFARQSTGLNPDSECLNFQPMKMQSNLNAVVTEHEIQGSHAILASFVSGVVGSLDELTQMLKKVAVDASTKAESTPQ